MATDELTDAWFIIVNWPEGDSPETIYYLPGADEGETRRTLVQAGVQLLSDKQAILDQKQGCKRITVVMSRGEANFGWVDSIRSSGAPTYDRHKYYVPDSDYAQTDEALEKAGFVKAEA